MFEMNLKRINFNKEPMHNLYKMHRSFLFVVSIARKEHFKYNKNS